MNLTYNEKGVYKLSTITIHKGECWMMHDPEYNKQCGIVPKNNVNAIRFDRPCIILTATNNIVTVIPLTTKETQVNTYWIQIEEERISYAILSQVTTISRSSLKYRIGVIKQNVFSDITDNFAKLIANPKYKVERRVQIVFNRLDIHRFYPFHMYRSVRTKEIFMVVRTSYQVLLKIPFVQNIGEHLTDGDENCFLSEYYDDKIRLRDFDTLDYSYFYEEFDDLGFEIREDARYRIIDYFQDHHNIKIRDIGYTDRMTVITKVLRNLGMHGYLKAYDCMKNTINDAFYQNLLDCNPDLYFDWQYEDQMKYEVQYENWIMRHLNPLTCNMGSLIYLQNFNPKLLWNYCYPYKKAFYLDGEHKTKKFNGRKFYGKYQLENVMFIYQFIKKLCTSPSKIAHKHKVNHRKEEV